MFSRVFWLFEKHEAGTAGRDASPPCCLYIHALYFHNSDCHRLCAAVRVYAYSLLVWKHLAWNWACVHLHVNTYMLHASACVFCSNMHVLYIWRHLWISTSFILVIIKWNSGGSFNYQSMKPNQLFLIIKSSLRNLIGWRFRDNDLRSLCDLLFFLLGSRDLVSCLSCLLVLYCYASKPLWRNFADRQCTSVSWHPETVYGFYFNSLVQCKAKLLHKENLW